ncbi:MAG: PD-(D/E)XK nuclease family protein [Limnochordia bacterium]|nr:PD-(D/E)XK nuclease family protein [Limnochordia bacterium]
MTCLYVVPNYYVRNFRRSLSEEGAPSQVTTMPGLVAQILKEGLVSYKEDRVLEEVAIWQSVHTHARDLQFFGPIAHYPGFKQELKWLFRQLDLGEDILAAMPQEGQTELALLHQCYHHILAEHGILSAPGQVKRSLDLAKKGEVLPEISSIRLQGLGELSPLEQELLTTLAQGRSLETIQPQAPAASLVVRKASDPVGEVEMIGQALRRQIEAGVPLERLGVAFPSPGQYLPLVIPIFAELKIPWRTPEVSLRNTPLGKTLLTTLLAELQGWHKHHFELLTAPGWGFPFGLTAEDHRSLRLAPPLKGLPAWRDYLGGQGGWNAVLDALAEITADLNSKPLQAYGIWIERLLDELEPERWVLPEDGLENWAELVKAWDGMHTIAQSLKEYDWIISPEQFIWLLECLLDSYQIQARRVFAERVQIMSVEQLGAYTYEQLYVGGLVEGQFPPRRSAHWLTKTRPHLPTGELYQRLSHGATHVNLFYPEVDRDGKLNLPATILPGAEVASQTLRPEPTHHPSLFLGRGLLEDERILAGLQRRILAEGLSVSQLNRYANCPFQFFCGHVLNLVPEEEASLELDARDHGNLVHHVLQLFWEKYLEGPLPSLDEGQAMIEGLLRKEYAKLGTIPSTSRIRDLRNFIRNDLGRAQQGFRPKYLEEWFQGLVIDTSLGPISVRGRIDRIDLNTDGDYVLYDYKTGSAPPIASMVEGKDVQIAAYLLAAQNLLPRGQNVGAAYYVIGDRSRKGIFHEDYAKTLGITRGKNVLAELGFAEQKQKFSAILQAYAWRILQGQFPIEPASARTCSFCAFQGICRKEVGLS